LVPAEEPEVIDYATWVAQTCAEPSIIRIPNEINEAIYGYSGPALQIMFYLAAQEMNMSINDNTQEYYYRLSFEELRRIIGRKSSREKKELVRGKLVQRSQTPKEIVLDYVDELRQLGMYIPVIKNPNGSTTNYSGGALAYAMVNVEEQTVDCYLPRPLVAMWRRLAAYTAIQWPILGLLTGKYAKRLYSLLLQYNREGRETTWGRAMTVAWLRKILAMKEDEYKNGADFKKRVIDSSIAQIDKVAPFIVSYTIRRGAKNEIREYTFLCTMKAKDTRTVKTKTTLAKQLTKNVDWAVTQKKVYAFMDENPDDSLVILIRAKQKQILARLKDEEAALEKPKEGEFRKTIDPEALQIGALDQALEVFREIIPSLLDRTPIDQDSLTRAMRG